MTIPTCPVCLGTAVAFLATPSDRSVVDYYRCACGHVWTADKVDQSVVTHVTRLPTLRPTKVSASKAGPPSASNS